MWRNCPSNAHLEGRRPRIGTQTPTTTALPYLDLLVSSLFRLCLFSSEPNVGAGPFPPGTSHDDGPKAPHVHAAVWAPGVPHGPARLPACRYARARFPPHGRPDGPTARVPYDKDADSARAQTARGPTQPAQHTTHAAAAPASVPAGASVAFMVVKQPAGAQAGRSFCLCK